MKPSEEKRCRPSFPTPKTKPKNKPHDPITGDPKRQINTKLVQFWGHPVKILQQTAIFSRPLGESLHEEYAIGGCASRIRAPRNAGKVARRPLIRTPKAVRATVCVPKRHSRDRTAARPSAARRIPSCQAPSLQCLRRNGERRAGRKFPGSRPKRLISGPG